MTEGQSAPADAEQQGRTSAGNEAQGVITRLHVLPEVHVGVVEDVGVQVEVVKALRRQNHANIIACSQQSHNS